MRTILLFKPAIFVPLLLVIFLSLEVPVFGQTYSMKLSNRRAVKPDWFGIGSQNTTRDGMYIDHPSLVARAPDMKAKVIRFPSGGNANWWDWKKGWFVNDPNSPPHKPNEAPVFNTLENFKVLVDATGGVPLFDLNMISATLQNQLEMLHYADSIGLEVKYIELGNEFYLAEEEDSTYIYSIFPDATVYGTVASKWIDSIHAHFPDAKVAAQGAFNRNNQPRRLEWDDDLVKTLEGEDAITLHEYYSSSGTEASGEGDGKYTMADVPEFLYRPFKAWNIMATEDLPMVRPGREVWITEYNMQDFNIPVHGSWGHALFVATQTLHFLESEKITNVNFHTLCGTSGYGGYFIDTKGFKFKDDGSFQEPINPPVSTPWDLTASGNAAKIVSEAADGMTYASQLSFEGIPQISLVDKGQTVTYPALYGWQFSNQNSSSAILVNLSGNDLKVNTADVFKTGGNYESISAQPTVYVSNAGKVIRKETTPLPTILTIKAWAIVKVTSSYVPAAPPSATITPSGATIFCQGDSVSLDAGTGYYAYLWSTGATTKKISAKTSGDYWLRVWNQKEGYWAADTITVTVNPAPEVPTIKNTGSDDFCQGASTILTPKKIDPAFSYLWSNGVTGTELTVTAAGNYKVTAIDSKGCSSVSAPVSIGVHPLPQPVISSQGSLAFCDGGSVVLDAGAGYKSYKWSNNKYGQQQTVSASGNFNVTVTDNNNCSNASPTVGVEEYAPPVSVVTINGPSAFCEGKSPTYLTGPSGYTAYQWYKGASKITGATDKKYTPSTSGTYKVTVTDNHNCSKQSAGAVITVLNPPKAKVTIDGSLNICGLETVLLTANAGSGYTYQWMKNGLDIPGAILIAYLVTSPGDYKVKVYDANGCKENSKVTTVKSECKEAADKGLPGAEPLLTIYPNPAASVIHLQTELSGENPVAYLEITNLLGEMVYEEEQTLNGNQFYTEVQLNSQFTNGVYIARVHCGAEVLISKFIVTGHE